jgi:diguanylate cyclase (GGDEF)-like protein
MRGDPTVVTHAEIDPATLDHQVLAEQMQQYMVRARITGANGPVASAYLVLTKWAIADPAWLIGWWCVLLCVDMFSVAHSTAYLRGKAPLSTDAMRRWRNRQIASQTLAGLVWGCSAILNRDVAQIEMQAAMILVVVHNVVVIGMLSFPRAATSWTIAIWSVPTAVLLWHGTLDHLRLALGIGVLVGSHSFYFSSVSSRLVEGIRKRLEADALAQALRASAERIHELATRDDLTGIYNRRHGMKLLKDWAHQPADRTELRSAPPKGLGLLMLDVDFFKRVNDAHGHPGGDEVLREVTRRLRAGLRDTDAIARVGGEEFMVLLPQVSPSGAVELADRLRAAVAQHPVLLPASVPVTISIGVALVQRGEGIDAAMSRADKALYVAKDTGRNRVVLAPEPGHGPGADAQPAGDRPPAPAAIRAA